MGHSCSTEVAAPYRQHQSLPFLLFWWKPLDFPWLQVALEDPTGKVLLLSLRLLLL